MEVEAVTRNMSAIFHEKPLVRANSAMTAAEPLAARKTERQAVRSKRPNSRKDITARGGIFT
jgi:hypothetical protein